MGIEVSLEKPSISKRTLETKESHPIWPNDLVNKWFKGNSRPHLPLSFLLWTWLGLSLGLDRLPVSREGEDRAEPLMDTMAESDLDEGMGEGFSLNTNLSFWDRSLIAFQCTSPLAVGISVPFFTSASQVSTTNLCHHAYQMNTVLTFDLPLLGHLMTSNRAKLSNSRRNHLSTPAKSTESRARLASSTCKNIPCFSWLGAQLCLPENHFCRGPSCSKILEQAWNWSRNRQFIAI